MLFDPFEIPQRMYDLLKKGLGIETPAGNMDYIDPGKTDGAKGILLLSGIGINMPEIRICEIEDLKTIDYSIRITVIKGRINFYKIKNTPLSIAVEEVFNGLIQSTMGKPERIK